MRFETGGELKHEVVEGAENRVGWMSGNASVSGACRTAVKLGKAGGWRIDLVCLGRLCLRSWWRWCRIKIRRDWLGLERDYADDVAGLGVAYAPEW